MMKRYLLRDILHILPSFIEIKFCFLGDVSSGVRRTEPLQGKEVAVGLYLELQTAKIEMNCRLMNRCQAQAEVSFQYFILYNHLISPI